MGQPPAQSALLFQYIHPPTGVHTPDKSPSARHQNDTIRQLQERVQGLENSRALDRTTGLEQQLRTTVERLQAVERNGIRIDGLSRETANLRGELSKLRAARPSETIDPKTDELPLGVPPLPPVRPPATAN